MMLYDTISKERGHITPKFIKGHVPLKKLIITAYNSLDLKEVVIFTRQFLKVRYTGGIWFTGGTGGFEGICEVNWRCKLGDWPGAKRVKGHGPASIGVLNYCYGLRTRKS